MSKEQVYQDLKTKILTLELNPGARLDETTFSKQYKISRTPLRDIFYRLAGEGFLNIIKNKGVYVSPMDFNTLHNFFLIAPTIYGIVGKLATKNATKKQIKSLEKNQSNFSRSVKKINPKEMVLWNQRFHSLIGEMANNQYIKPSYDRLLIDHARISQTFYRSFNDNIDKTLNKANNHHQEMIDCIINKNSKRMVEVTKEHWNLSRIRMQMFVTPNSIEFDEFNEA